MKYLVQTACLFSFLVILFSCGKTNENKKQIVGIIGNDTLYVNEIDVMVQQQLYDYLCNIYRARKIAFEETAKERVLLMEAKRAKISKEELLKQNIDNKVTENGLKTFIKEHQLESGLQLIKNKELVVYTLQTEEGRKAYIESYKEFLKKNFIDTLLKKYNFKIVLEPPVFPRINLSDINIHLHGKADSKITVSEISDLDCGVCKEAAPLYNTIFQKYKDKINWGFINFSSDVTLAATAAEAAGKQGKFWEMHDLLIKSEHIFDTLSCYKLAEKLNLDLTKFKKDIKDTSVHNLIQKTILKLKDAKFYATPTIVVNGRIISNSSSQTDIEKAIEDELGDTK
jgi:protein-disulfide isomerase